MTTQLTTQKNLYHFYKALNEAQCEIYGKLEESASLYEVIKSKNLFNSLRPTPDNWTSRYLLHSYQVSEVKKLEFGSAHCYLTEMASAVKALLEEDHMLTSQECAVLQKWLEATGPALEISCLLDYFRIRIPSVIDSLAKGKDPFSTLSLRQRAYFALYLPSTQELKAISQYIVDCVERLEPNGFFAFPWGNLSHETLLVVENAEDQFHLRLIDPNSRAIKTIQLSTPEQIQDLSFWQHLLKAKFQKEHDDNFWQKLSCKLKSETDFLPEEQLIRRQKSNQCFAYAHWQLLRYIASMPTMFLQPETVELSKSLELKIRQKMLDLSPHKDSSLGKYTAHEIESKSIKVALLSEPDRIKALCSLALKLIEMPSPLLPNDRKRFLQEKNRTLILSFLSGKPLTWKERKSIFKMIKEFQIAEEARIPLSKLSEEEIELVVWLDHQRDLGENVSKYRYDALIPLLEAVESFQHRTITTFLDQNTQLLRRYLKDEMPYTVGISHANLVQLIQGIYSLLEQQSSLEEVQAMAHRLIEVALKGYKIHQCMARDKIKFFLEDCRFQSHKEWESIKEELFAAMDSSLASSLF